MPDQYLYKFPTYSSKKIAFVKNESVLKIIKENEDWLLLESNDVKGWLTKKSVWGG
jgi:SH3-like domain-containing protein